MNTTIPNFEEIKVKFIDILSESGWSAELKSYLYSHEFDLALNMLYRLKQEDKRFTPPLKTVFKAFEDCPFDKIKVVVLGQDPYPQIGVANGVAFCCSLPGKVQPSLRYILKAINKTVYDKDVPNEELNPSLAHLTEQGVLLLNTSLTCEIGKPASHYHIWNEFITYVIDRINSKKENIVFLLLGKRAQEFEDLIDEDKHHVVKASHPASAAYAKDSVWDCSDCFNKVNELLTEKIKW
jgi:uracil-DNA glycosylase